MEIDDPPISFSGDSECAIMRYAELYRLKFADCSNIMSLFSATMVFDLF